MLSEPKQVEEHPLAKNITIWINDNKTQLERLKILIKPWHYNCFYSHDIPNTMVCYKNELECKISIEYPDEGEEFLYQYRVGMNNFVVDRNIELLMSWGKLSIVTFNFIKHLNNSLPKGYSIKIKLLGDLEYTSFYL